MLLHGLRVHMISTENMKGGGGVEWYEWALFY